LHLRCGRIFTSTGWQYHYISFTDGFRCPLGNVRWESYTIIAPPFEDQKIRSTRSTRGIWLLKSKNMWYCSGLNVTWNYRTISPPHHSSFSSFKLSHVDRHLDLTWLISPGSWSRPPEVWLHATVASCHRCIPELAWLKKGFGWALGDPAVSNSLT